MTNQEIIPIILCGGSGTRLWPLSRESYPKQFLNLEENNNQSLLQNTCERFLSIKNVSNPILICNKEHRFIAAEQLRNININPKSILLEPLGRGTAPAVALAAFKAMENNENPFLLVLSSDHIISNKDNLIKALNLGMNYAEKGRLVTFGVKPDYPETGYGYIESKIMLKDDNEGGEIKRFIEKPSLTKAKEYIENKNFFWNSGIFLFRANDILREIKKFEPMIFENCQKALNDSQLDLDFERIEVKHFSNCENISLDVAVMERTTLGTVIPIEIGWKDIGSWNQLWDYSTKDKSGNVIKGDLIIENSKNCFFRSEERLIVGINLEDIIVVETNDAVLIVDRFSTQEIKKIVEILKKKKYKESYEHSKVYRPWGYFTTLVEDKNWKVKKIVVNPNSSLSSQLHKQRSEHWTVVNGSAEVEVDGNVSILNKNQSTYIPKNCKHRLANPNNSILTLIEVQNGDYLGEDDIIRFEDNYGRKNNFQSNNDLSKNIEDE